MIKLEVGNSYSRLTGLSVAQEKELKAILSYTIGGSAAFFSGHGVRKKALIDKKGYFPTGLLHRLPSWVYPQYAKIDSRIRPQFEALTVESGSYYNWQLGALDKAILFGRGIITAPTGTGKSRVISMISKYYGLKTLVVVPSLEIKKQLKLTFFENNVNNVTVENIDSKALQTDRGFDVLIIDEGHHVAAKTYQKLNKTTWKDIYYRFYLTATPFRNDSEETLLFESIAGQVIYKLDYKTAVKEKYIVPIEAYIIECPKQATKGYTYNEVYAELVVNNANRNLMIAQLLETLQEAGKSTLCLVKEVAHSRILAELTNLPFVVGPDPDSRMFIDAFNKGLIKTLIATTALLGEGIDTKPCEYVVIAGGGKAKSQFMQQVGRAVRTYPGKESAKIVLIKDTSHKYVLRHYKEQVKILKDEYGVKPFKLELK